MICWWRKSGKEFVAATQERNRTKVGRMARLRGQTEAVMDTPSRKASIDAELEGLLAEMRAAEMEKATS